MPFRFRFKPLVIQGVLNYSIATSISFSGKAISQKSENISKNLFYALLGAFVGKYLSFLIFFDQKLETVGFFITEVMLSYFHCCFSCFLKY